jgi:hypothetical protein
MTYEFYILTIFLIVDFTIQHISNFRFHNHFIPSKDYRKYSSMCDAVTLHSGGGKIYIYIYICMYTCVCVCVYIYIYIFSVY